MKAKLNIFLILTVLLLGMTSCSQSQPEYMATKEDVMNDIRLQELQALVDSFDNGKITSEAFERIFQSLNQEDRQAISRIRGNRLVYRHLTEEERMEQFIRRRDELRVNNVQFIVDGDYTPAPSYVDFNNIERVVFFEAVGINGFGLVLDRTHGRAFYDPSNWNVFYLNPNSARTIASFRESDLDRFIEIIEKANVREWQTFFTGSPSPDNMPIRNWQLGILFSDGTILRHGGIGDGSNGIPPIDQYAILTNFIRTIGTEIVDRSRKEHQEAESIETEE